jgi:FkbM family methyltransferase
VARAERGGDSVEATGQPPDQTADRQATAAPARALQLLRRLRPAKIRNGLRRRWFEYRLERTKLAPAPGVREMGSKYGGWVMPAELIGRSWLCYCVGAGGDVSFDVELMRDYGATVRAFDPVERSVVSAREEAAGNPRFSAHMVALAAEDGPVRMQITHDPGSASVSAAGLYESDRFTEVPGRTLSSLMAEYGDERIELLKIDIEGAEYDVLPTLDLAAAGVKLFAVQLHHNGSVGQARALIRRLRDAGYVPVGCRSAVKLTFAHRDLLAGADAARGTAA